MTKLILAIALAMTMASGMAMAQGGGMGGGAVGGGVAGNSGESTGVSEKPGTMTGTGGTGMSNPTKSNGQPTAGATSGSDSSYTQKKP